LLCFFLFSYSLTFLFLDILRHATTCREKVSSDSSIQLRYTAKLLDTNEIIENKTLDLKPGTALHFYKNLTILLKYALCFTGELTVVKGINDSLMVWTIKLISLLIGLEQGIQGMCTGEIRRLTVPSALHVCKFFFS
jgi:FKBP-type peptidyl-prolyl cis-trans isomerase 2